MHFSVTRVYGTSYFTTLLILAVNDMFTVVPMESVHGTESTPMLLALSLSAFLIWKIAARRIRGH